MRAAANMTLAASRASLPSFIHVCLIHRHTCWLSHPAHLCACRWLQGRTAGGSAGSSSSSAELRRRLLITLLEVLFYYYPSLLTTTLSLFACFHIDPSGSANAEYHNAQVSNCATAAAQQHKVWKFCASCTSTCFVSRSACLLCLNGNGHCYPFYQW